VWHNIHRIPEKRGIGMRKENQIKNAILKALSVKDWRLSGLPMGEQFIKVIRKTSPKLKCKDSEINKELNELIEKDKIVFDENNETYKLTIAMTIKSFEDLKIQAMLDEEKPEFQSLGIGIHNGVLYFGTKLNDEEGRFYDAIVTSDKRIYINWDERNEIKDIFNLNYRFPLFDDVLDAMWSRTGKYGIKVWLYGNLRNISLKKAYEKVMKLLKWKMWHPDERTYKHHTLKIISTYFLPIFEMKGRELIYGESGFGKTRQTKIYQLLVFNPSMSMDWSDAGVFRSIESTKASILIDNFDTVEKEKRGRIIHIYNTGAYTRQKAVRSVGKTFRPTGFNVFSSLILNTIIPLNEVSENRSNITRCLRTDNKKYWKLEENNPIWSETMDMLHICALQNFKTIQNIYKKLTAEETLFSREFERVSDTLTIAKAISNDLYKEMLDYYVEEKQRRKIRDLKDDWLYVALEYIIEKMEKEKEFEVTTKNIGENCASQIFDSDSKYFDSNVFKFKRHIGKTFKNCPLFKSKLLHGYSCYTFDRESLLKFCKMKNFDELVEKLQPTIKDYTTPPTPPTLPNTLNTPNTPKHNSINNKKGGLGGLGGTKHKKEEM